MQEPEPRRTRQSARCWELVTKPLSMQGHKLGKEPVKSKAEEQTYTENNPANDNQPE